MTADLTLRPLRPGDEEEAWRAHDELAREGFDFLLDGRRDDWALAVARSVGVEEALVTCDDDNVASARTIERCGGVLQDVVCTGDGSPKRRYLIATGGTS